MEAATFVSKRYGYRLTLAGRWKATFARTAWTGGFPVMAAGEVDVFTQSSGDRFFVVAATRVPAGTTLPAWARSHTETMEDFPGCKASGSRSTTLGGGPAREFEIGCLSHDAIVVAALHRGRGYTFQYVAPRPSADASDRRTYEPARRAFRYTA